MKRERERKTRILPISHIYKRNAGKNVSIKFFFFLIRVVLKQPPAICTSALKKQGLVLFLPNELYRGPRLLWAPLNTDNAVFRTRQTESVCLTRYTRPRLIRTMISIPDKSALTNASVLSGHLCIGIAINT